MARAFANLLSKTTYLYFTANSFIIYDILYPSAMFSILLLNYWENDSEEVEKNIFINLRGKSFFLI